ncbi:MAG: hypothetical protein ACKESB_03100 [Candidatus Hodgkinia cicadicola]
MFTVIAITPFVAFLSLFSRQAVVSSLSAAYKPTLSPFIMAPFLGQLKSTLLTSIIY